MVNNHSLDVNYKKCSKITICVLFFNLPKHTCVINTCLKQTKLEVLIIYQSLIQE